MRSTDQPFPDCSLCRRARFKRNRVAWGCDAPAPRPLYRTTCGCNGDDRCKLCGGSGEKPVRRCPGSQLAAANPKISHELAEAMRFYIEYDNRNILPVPGGWYEQSASFMRFCGLVDNERGRWEKTRQEHMKKAHS